MECNLLNTEVKFNGARIDHPWARSVTFLAKNNALKKHSGTICSFMFVALFIDFMITEYPFFG